MTKISLTTTKLLADKASDWLANSFDTFHGQLNTALDPETLCTVSSELALFCWLLTGYNSDRKLWKGVVQILKNLKDLGTQGKLHEIVSRHTRAAAVGLLIHELALGYSRDDLSKVAEWLLSTNVLNVPRTAMRDYELQYFLNKCGVADSELRAASIHQFLLKSTYMPLEWVEYSEIYEFTHFVYYGTDFGQAKQAFLLPEKREKLAKQSEELMSLCLRKHHADLIAELTLASWCLTGPGYDQRGWPYLVDIVDNLDSMAESWQSFLKMYHPILVTALTAHLSSRSPAT